MAAASVVGGGALDLPTKRPVPKPMAMASAEWCGGCQQPSFFIGVWIKGGSHDLIPDGVTHDVPSNRIVELSSIAIHTEPEMRSSIGEGAVGES